MVCLFPSFKIALFWRIYHGSLWWLYQWSHTRLSPQSHDQHPAKQFSPHLCLGSRHCFLQRGPHSGPLPHPELPQIPVTVVQEQVFQMYPWVVLMQKPTVDSDVSRFLKPHSGRCTVGCPIVTIKTTNRHLQMVSPWGRRSQTPLAEKHYGKYHLMYCLCLVALAFDFSFWRVSFSLTTENISI